MPGPRFHQFWLILAGFLFLEFPLWPVIGGAQPASPAPGDSVHPAAADDHGPEIRQLIVRLRSPVTAVQKQALLGRLSTKVTPLSRLSPRFAKQAEPGKFSSLFSGLMLVDLPEGADARAVAKSLSAHPEVLYAEPNYPIKAARSGSGEVVPNDLEFGRLWGLHNTGQNGGKKGVDIDATEAWTLTQGSSNVLVAIIDTGIDYFHPDLEENLWTNSKEIPGNGIDDDHNGYIDDVHGYDFVSGDGDPSDDHGHGTHVAGIVGAKGGNKRGVTGVCWSVSLMSLKALDESGSGDTAGAIEAIGYAVNNGAKIINASWGMSEKSQALEEAILEAQSAGVLFIAAAGNGAADHPFYPAAYDSVIAVAAINSLGERSSFSNYGKYVDLAAPGEDIYSTLPNNSFDAFSGTSMAAPYVTGVAALILARHPEFTPAQTGAILRNSVDPSPSELQMGAGVINAYKALLNNRPLPDARLVMPPAIFGVVDILGTAGGEGFTRYSLAYGQGNNPTNWTIFHHSDQPVKEGVLSQAFSTASLAEGIYRFELTVEGDEGHQAVDRATVAIQNVHISFPLNNDVLRAGDRLQILGTVFGQERTYALEYGIGWQPKEWFTAGMDLADGGSRQVVNSLLATWDTSQLRSNEFYTLKLTARDPAQDASEHRVHMVYLDGQLKPGWPQYLPADFDYPSEDWRNIKVADLDGDGQAELIVADAGNSEGKPPRLLVYRNNGELFWEKTFPAGPPYSDIPLVGDIDNDGRMEIFVNLGAGSQIYGFRYDGSKLPGNWPVPVEGNSYAKVMADLDGDGSNELIAYSQDGVNDQRTLLVLDRAGAVRARWKLPFCPFNPDAAEVFPAVGKLEDDRDLEIVAVSDCNAISLFDLQKTNGPVWTAQVEGTLTASPVIGDLNHDGTNEIVIGTFDINNQSQGGLYAFDRNGKRLPGWPVLVDESFAVAPALGDLQGDGNLEISIESWPSRKLHLVQHDGFEAPGWPVSLPSKVIMRSSSVLGDIDGDGRPDVVIPALGLHYFAVKMGDLSSVGGVMAWNFQGHQLDLNLHTNLSSLVMESSGGPWLKSAALTLCDVDRNGKLDIVATTIQDLSFSIDGPITRKGRGSIYIWELDVPFRPENFPWPALQGNAQNTGYLTAPPRPNQAPVVSEIPDQTIPTGAGFSVVELDRFVEDPDNRPEEISWTAWGNSELQVLVDTQRVAHIIQPSPDWAGSETIWFIARDPGNLSASNRVHFAARPGYRPPVASPDAAQTLEDHSVEIDFLGNDVDPNGGSLTVLHVSKPLSGKIVPEEGSKWRYIPRPDFHGADSVQYTIQDSSGSIAQGEVSITVLPVNDAPWAVDDTAITWEDVPVTIEALKNDQDVDGDPLRVVEYTEPASGTLALGDDGVFRYTPNKGFFGFDYFTYTVRDPAGLASNATVYIMVKRVNRPPTILDQEFVLNKNASQMISFPLADADGDTLSFAVVQGPEHGVLWLYPTAAVYYPRKGFVGEDHFVYLARDHSHESEPATVSLAMIDQNNPPSAEGLAVRVHPGKRAVLPLRASDADDDPLAYSIVSPPLHGTLEAHGTNYTYQSEPDFLGGDQFTFRVQDPFGAAAEGLVTITVTDINTPPLAEDSTVATIMNVSTLFGLAVTDGELDQLDFEIITPPGHGGLITSGPDALYFPETDFVGTDRFTFKANDGQADSAVASVTIFVNFPNHAPAAQNQNLFARKNQSAKGSLAVTDADGNELKSALLKGPQHGILALQGTNLIYQPRLDFVGTDVFTYKVWDGYTYGNQGTVSVTVFDDLPPSFEAIKSFDHGAIALSVRTVPGTTLRLEASADFRDWAPLASKTADQEFVIFVDTNAAPLPARFYRVVQVAP